MKSTIVSLFLCIFAAVSAFGAEKQIWAKSFLNQPAPELVVEKWLSKEPDRKDKFVLIDFWATWCGPCRKAIPELNAFHKKFGGKLVVIGLSDETEKKVKGMTDPKMEYFSAIDTKGRTKKAVAVTGIPHVLIIDPKGVVRWEGFPLLEGYELTEEVVKGVLEKYAT
jgi:cytochrome c biogenesis protein CcmG/thiol:disulfide interchange protein DsbE